MAKTQVSQAQIDKILRDADGVDFGAPGAHKATAQKAAALSLSVAGFKTFWPKVRPVVMAAIGLLSLFRRTDSAKLMAQLVVLVDLIVSGELPIEEGL